MTTEDRKNFDAIKARADEGDASAFMLVAHTYASRTQCVPNDDALAVQYYIRAHDAGIAAGTYWLSRMHAEGRGVLRDDTRAMILLEHAANAGDLSAKRDLGRHYLERKTPADIQKAFTLFRDYTLLAPQEIERTKDSPDVMFYPMLLACGVGCEKDPRAAHEILADLCEKGFRHAQEAMESGKIGASRIALQVTAAGLACVNED